MRRCGMIAKFDSLSAGHSDMDNVGYAGTAVNDRLHARRQCGERRGVEDMRDIVFI